MTNTVNMVSASLTIMGVVMSVYVLQVAVF